MSTFKPTLKQQQANLLLASPATDILLYGGSRSGKTFIILRAIINRALKAPGSRHAVLRFRLNHLVASIIHDTWPKVLEHVAPGLKVPMREQNLFSEFPNGSQVWWGGLDDQERVEKVLGQEHSGIFLNECSQISYTARNFALTRRAQKVNYTVDGVERPLKVKMWYDCNPPLKSHWTYKLFFEHVDPAAPRVRLPNPEDYVCMQMNPQDNIENQAEGYVAALESLPSHLRKRFLMGEYGDVNPDALFTQSTIDKWRVDDTPELQRIVVAVDPSGAADETSEGDAIGIVVAGLGVDGIGYLLEDLTLKDSPSVWGKVATAAYDRHMADRVVGEVNYGGAMVEFVIKTARPNTPFRMVHASRGKVIRAEPISALYDNGMIRHAGQFPELEDELLGFSTTGYVGEASPNRADAAIWAFTDLFPGLVNPRKMLERAEVNENAPYLRAQAKSRRERRERLEAMDDWVV